MKVYVLEVGAYDERDIKGVYMSLAAAKAAAPSNPPRWKKQESETWWNRSIEYDQIAWVSAHDLQPA